MMLNPILLNQCRADVFAEDADEDQLNGRKEKQADDQRGQSKFVFVENQWPNRSLKLYSYCIETLI